MPNQNESLFPDLDKLLIGVVEGSLDARDSSHLHELMITDATARNTFLQYMQLHAMLLWQDKQWASDAYGHNAISPSESLSPCYAEHPNTHYEESDVRAEQTFGQGIVSVPSEKVRGLPRGNNVRPSTEGRFSGISTTVRKVMGVSLLVAAVSVMFMLAVLSQLHYATSDKSRLEAPASAPLVARLTHCISCRWGKASEDVVLGAQLAAGQVLDLQQGIIELRFKSGAVVLIEGPTQFQLNSRNDGSLILGRLSARVPERAVGFTVRTPTTDIVDLGTEFDAVVQSNGETEVHVHSGEVELVPHLLPESPAYARRKLTAGEGVKIVAGTDGKPAVVKSVPFRSQRLVQRPQTTEARLISATEARASSIWADNRGPENLIDGRGLDGKRHTSLADYTMWHSDDNKIEGEFVIFDLGEVHGLHSLRIWNFNEAYGQADSESHGRFALLRGVQQADIYTSLTGEADPQSKPVAWSLARRGVRLNPGDATNEYDSPDLVLMNGTVGRYVAIVIQSDFLSDRMYDPAYRKEVEKSFPNMVGLSDAQFHKAADRLIPRVVGLSEVQFLGWKED